MPKDVKRELKSGAGLFFDRDGTLMHDKGYLSDPSGVVLLPGVREALIKLHSSCRIFLFTNQSGVARGYFGMDAVERVNGRLLELLGCGDDFFDGICVAVEHPDAVQVYRKPSPRFILESIEKYGLNREKCVMFGDRTSDLQAAINAKITAVRVTQDIDDKAAAEYAAEHGLTSISSVADFAAAYGGEAVGKRI